MRNDILKNRACEGFRTGHRGIMPSLFGIIFVDTLIPGYIPGSIHGAFEMTHLACVQYSTVQEIPEKILSPGQEYRILV
jgi:hypothetical protein